MLFLSKKLCFYRKRGIFAYNFGEILVYNMRNRQLYFTKIGASAEPLQNRIKDTLPMSVKTYKIYTWARSLMPSITFALIGAEVVCAQNTSGYGYLEVPVSARVWALGGTNISVVEPEMSLAEQNPALLCPEMEGQMALNYTRYYGDINMGYAGYAGRFLEEGGWSAGMRFIDYGDFRGYDEQGISTGGFGVKDLSLQGAVGYPVNERLRIGAQAKFLYSSYESYSAFAMGVDLGMNYYDETTGNSFSITATNLGGQFKALFEERKESMPTQLNVGWSRELQHLPLCLSVTGYHLLDWKHDFRDGNGVVQEFKDAEMVLNHLIFGLEWTASEHFWLAASYNYRNQRRFIHQGGFLRGIALGAGINHRSMSVQLAYASVHAGNGTLSFQFNYTF